MNKGRIFCINEKNIGSQEALEDWMSLVQIPIAISENPNSLYGVHADWTTINSILNEGNDVLLITHKISKEWNNVFFIKE